MATAQKEANITDKFVEKYGYRVPVGTPILALELLAYRDGITEEQGGLGPEQHFKNAWRILWPEFEWSDWTELMVWAWNRYKWINVIGHRRASKTYTHAHICWLDYYANPYATSTSLATVNFQGLKVRMWSDLLVAVSTAKVQKGFQVRSTTNELRIYPNESSHEAGERFQIQGIAVPNTQDAQSRIKGAHAPRRRYFLDEAEDIAEPIYDAMGNPMSAPDAKCVKMANPVEKVSRFGNECEPKGGWSTVSEADLFWETKMGGICLHFNGLLSPNVKSTGKIFTGILTKADIEETRAKKGEDSVEWWSQILGYFAPDGMVSRIFPSKVIEMAKEPLKFDYATDPCASLDPGFGGDACALHFGAKGRLRDGRTAINATGSEHLVFKVGANQELIDHQIADQIITKCRDERRMKPKNFIMDKSGPSRGVYAILYKKWSPEIHGVDYGGKCTERPVREDEPDRACDVYEKFVTELWFRASACVQDGILGGLSNLHPLTAEDLHARRYTTKKTTDGTVQVAEPKDEMRKRLSRSPDDGDAFTQFGELLIREGHGPGRKKSLPSENSRWSQSRVRAVRAASRYSEKSEFSHHFSTRES